MTPGDGLLGSPFKGRPVTKVEFLGRMKGTRMTLLRRALAAVGIAGVVAVVLRLRGSGGTPPQTGGWRELSGSDLS